MYSVDANHVIEIHGVDIVSGLVPALLNSHLT